MPVNKAARVRFEIIDECLRNTLHKWSKRNLLDVVNKKLEEKCGNNTTISLSQIRNDLNDMQAEYGAPINTVKEGTSVYYIYEDINFSINKLPLEEEDVLRLREVVDIMQQIKGFTIADEIEGIVQRLEHKIKLRSNEKMPVIAFENPPTVLGSDFLGDLYNSIIKKQVLKITYKHFYASESYQIIFSPYFLKEYNNRWFLFGWSDKNKRVENLALDRISDIRVTNGVFKSNESFDSINYFKNIIGVTQINNSVVDQIELLFSKTRSPYITTKRIHESQKIIKEYKNGKILIGLSLIINKELITQILSFGEDVEVKKPEKLRLEIKDRLEGALKQYE
ncbi:MAG: hypothetical protein CUR34_07640 [Sediminibacterium sp.]|nr:MAG: hypothetical protein CUR34_07640 [Sediminibacterium sp.] [Sediminibacterium sp. FEMGT703S]